MIKDLCESLQKLHQKGEDFISIVPNASYLPTLLQTISWAAQTLTTDPRQLASVTKVLLGDLRRATQMEAAELYLADPAQQHLIRAGHSGLDAPAFSERSLFRFGEGFPGLAAQQKRPIETSNLENDERYLRGQVRALGYQSFLSYPLVTPFAVIGVLNLASHEAARLTGAHLALQLIAPLLASSLYCVMTSLSEQTLQRVRRAELGRQRALTLLEDSLMATSALRAVLRTPDGHNIETHPEEIPHCQGSDNCPAATGSICVSGMAQLSCSFMPQQPHMVCLPLWNDGRIEGVTSVQFSARGKLGSEDVAPLLWMSRLVAGELGLKVLAPAEEKTLWLDIQTFGAFRVRRNGQTLSAADFKRRQAYQLLKVLVTRWGRPVQMEELCESLWPGESVSDKVLARLHVTLNALRQVLEPSGEQRGKVLLRDGAAYRFAPTVPWCLDAAEFETLVHKGDAQTGEAAMQSYAQALKLYRGDYLEDDPYADTFALERDYLRELAIHALFRCAEYAAQSQNIQQALTSYSQLLTIDPLRFDAHEALISLLDTQGRHEEAGARWERYAQAYGSNPPMARP